MTTILRGKGGILGSCRMYVECDLSNASAPVYADYCVDGERGDISSTPYQCADARHSVAGLLTIADDLARAACEDSDSEDTGITWTVVDA